MPSLLRLVRQGPLAAAHCPAAVLVGFSPAQGSQEELRRGRQLKQRLEQRLEQPQWTPKKRMLAPLRWPMSPQPTRQFRIRRAPANWSWQLLLGLGLVLLGDRAIAQPVPQPIAQAASQPTASPSPSITSGSLPAAQPVQPSSSVPLPHPSAPSQPPSSALPLAQGVTSPSPPALDNASPDTPPVNEAIQGSSEAGRPSVSKGSIYAPIRLESGLGIKDTLSTKDIPMGQGSFARDYVVTLRANDQVAIDLVSDSFDTVVTLMSETGKTLGENDDGPDGGTNSLLFMRITQDGDYVVRVRGFGQAKGGPFQLKLTRLKAE